LGARSGDPQEDPGGQSGPALRVLRGLPNTPLPLAGMKV
jgi:hypothetical protein